MNNKGRQDGYSEIRPDSIFNSKGRERKARKTLAILQNQIDDLKDCRLLDIGCGAGRSTIWYAAAVATAVGVDIDRIAISDGQLNANRENLSYAIMSSEAVGFPDEIFDIIICNHVYEHVPDSVALMREIRRLLKPDGICYFGAGNRFSWMEPHYQLPLLSVIPKVAAHWYLRLLKRGDEYYETHLSYWGLRRLVSDFNVIDYSIKVVQDPAKYHALDMVMPNSSKQKKVLLFLKYFYWLCPTYLWLLQKTQK